MLFTYRNILGCRYLLDMFSLLMPIATFLFFQIGLSEATQIITPLNERDPTPECKGECSGSWNDWNQWSSCHGGNCHVVLGIRTRKRNCHISSPARGDIAGTNYKRSWVLQCTETVEEQCACNKTCTGAWGNWGPWTQCITSSRTNETCHMSRRRVCNDVVDSGKRVNGENCLGGLDADSMQKDCARDVCKTVEKTTIPQPVILYPNAAIAKSASDDKPQSNKDNANVGQHTLIILAASLGALVFAVVFIIVLINVVKRNKKPHTERNYSESGDQWTKNTYTSSYVAASEVMSPVITDNPEVRSPSSMTVASGSSSSSSNQCPFSRNDSVFMYSAADSNGLTLDAFAQRPRRSRLMQENVYWEISEQARENGEENGVSLANNRQEITNVLYDVDA